MATNGQRGSNGQQAKSMRLVHRSMWSEETYVGDRPFVSTTILPVYATMYVFKRPMENYRPRVHLSSVHPPGYPIPK